MVQKVKKLKNNFFRAYANAGIILFIPTMLLKKEEIFKDGSGYKIRGIPVIVRILCTQFYFPILIRLYVK
jgi:hypothetical protein